RVAHLWFFFSSRRRHTRSTRDWSSDVCSSDLATRPKGIRRGPNGLPGIRDVEHECVHAGFGDRHPSIAKLELDASGESCVRNVCARDLQKVGTEVIGHHVAIRTNRLSQDQGQGTGAGSDLHHEVARLHVTIPYQRWRIFRANDLCLTSHSANRVSD